MLARLEAKIAIEELLRRRPDTQLAGPVTRLRSSLVHGIKSIKVQL